jgi:hypothetical protein
MSMSRGRTERPVGRMPCSGVLAVNWLGRRQSRAAAYSPGFISLMNSAQSE